MKANLPGVGAEVHLSRQADQDRSGFPPSIEDILAPLVALVAEGDTGIVLTVDEAQDAAAEELRALATFHQRAVEANWPVVLLVAGLPPLRTGGLKSSFERADWFDIGPLSPPATLTALAEPAVRAGRPYEAGAAEHLAVHTGGYPYAVQLYGHAAWRRSQGQPVISAGAVDLAVPSAGAQLRAQPLQPALAAHASQGTRVPGRPGRNDRSRRRPHRRSGRRTPGRDRQRPLHDKGAFWSTKGPWWRPAEPSASWCRDWPPMCSARSASQPRSATSSPCRSRARSSRPRSPLRPARARFSTRRALGKFLATLTAILTAEG